MKPDEENDMQGGNLATMKPAATEPTLASVGEIINQSHRTTRTEIEFLDTQRRLSTERRTQLDREMQALRDQLADKESAFQREGLRLEVISKMARLRRHVLADVESER